jgi:nitroimidazol reductase NimA-like FMN-containing flavoprotein (pyridoxamine 5'-phosphate oxidase superfamily)
MADRAVDPHLGPARSGGRGRGTAQARLRCRENRLKEEAKQSDGNNTVRPGACSAQPKKARYDEATIAAILDRALVAHIAFVVDGQPVCIPTLCARTGGSVYIHGSRASRTMRVLGSGGRACLTATLVHGLVLARSAFEHSVNYESVIAFGRLVEIDGDQERLAALQAFTDKLIPGRFGEVRPPSRQELKATMILRMEIEEASAKVRRGPPDDDDTADALQDTWAGEVPILTRFSAPVPSPALRPSIGLPKSVERLLAGTQAIPPSSQPHGPR